MTPDRLTALADAIEKIPSGILDNRKLYEAATLIRSLSVVEPAAMVLPNERISFANNVELPPATLLYLHPASALLDPPQAPAEGAADLLREVLGSLEHEIGATKVDRWFPEARAFIARSNVSRKEPVEQRSKQDEQETSGKP